MKEGIRYPSRNALMAYKLLLILSYTAIIVNLTWWVFKIGGGRIF